MLKSVGLKVFDRQNFIRTNRVLNLFLYTLLFGLMNFSIITDND